MTNINIKGANVLDDPLKNKASHCIIQTDSKKIFDDYADYLIKNSLRQDNPVQYLDIERIINNLPEASAQYRLIDEACNRTQKGTLIVYRIDAAPINLQQRFKTLIDAGAKKHVRSINFYGRFIFWSKNNDEMDRGLLTWINSALFPDLPEQQSLE